MTDSTALFKSASTFHQGFVQGLGDMLERPELGVFILVLANATFDENIFSQLKSRLRNRFDMESERFRSDLTQGRPLTDAPDDVLVFLKLMAVGFDALEVTSFRNAGPFELQFNQLRAFRPPRMSNAVVDSNRKDFDANGFHFNKPFLKKEILWEGELSGVHARLLYNKFPFAHGHGLLVLEPEQQRPQYLTPEHHQQVVDIVTGLGEKLPGLGLAYNAYGAYASVNHQHFQWYVRDSGEYPVELDQWAHNGGNEDYPVNAFFYGDFAAAGEYIEQLNQKNVSYNLLYRPKGVYVLQRAKQGSYQHAEWTSGFAWSEIMGAVTTFSDQDFKALSEAVVRAEFAKLAI